MKIWEAWYYTEMIWFQVSSDYLNFKNPSSSYYQLHEFEYTYNLTYMKLKNIIL